MLENDITSMICNEIIDKEPWKSIKANETKVMIKRTGEIGTVIGIGYNMYGDYVAKVKIPYGYNNCYVNTYDLTDIMPYKKKAKYHDNDYVVCADIDKPDVTYSFGLVSNIIHDMFPITMPYSPGKPIFVLCDCFLTDKANGDFDTVGVFSALKQNGNIVERTRFTKINKFFREASKDEKGPWIEITKKEYYERKAKAIKGK